MLYFMLTGKLPFTSDAEQLLHAQIKEAHFTFPKDLSADAKSLIRSLLTPKPEQRLSAAQALDHPWFAGNLAPRPKSCLAPAQVAGYLRLERMQKLVVAYIAAHTSDAALLQQMQEFVEINTSRTGVLSKEEVDKWITGKNVRESSDEVFDGMNISKTKGLEYFGSFYYSP